jgi:hypothetical protein
MASKKIPYRLQTKEDYDRAFSVVSKVICEWDPYSLLAGGAPKDEFDGEVRDLIVRIRHIRSEQDTIEAVSEVFGAAFGADEFGVERCQQVGVKLFSELKSAGILHEEV